MASAVATGETYVVSSASIKDCSRQMVNKKVKIVTYQSVLISQSYIERWWHSHFGIVKWRRSYERSNGQTIHSIPQKTERKSWRE